MSDAVRHALVTGSSSGIGLAVAQALLDGGWRVTGADRAQPVIEAENFTPVACDLMDDAAARTMAADVQGITALVHAAGFLRVGALGTLDHDAGVEMWRLHVDAAIVLADALAPRMSQGGRIVLIGSRAAQGAANRSQYAATKAALVGLARSWAKELAPRGITVNVIAPAATETPMLHDAARGNVPPVLPPIGRFVRPEEIAALALFLLSDHAAAITGQQITVCGGASL
jgi:NAD(P)-dependent dehydrogenase (short-subunit alcohol dehydrogenase family)